MYDLFSGFYPTYMLSQGFMIYYFFSFPYIVKIISLKMHTQSLKALVTIIIAGMFCASPPAKTHKTFDDENWIDGNTLHIVARGMVPIPRRDPTTNKLMACQNARSEAIKKFHDRYIMPDTNPYYSGKYSSGFHRERIEIQTFNKDYDRDNNCTITLRFQSKGLQGRIRRKE